MMVYHLSPSNNRDSILEHGLLTARAQTVARLIWLVPGHMVAWSHSHVRRRHRLTATDTVDLWCVALPPRLVRVRAGGLLTTCQDIHPGLLHLRNPGLALDDIGYRPGRWRPLPCRAPRNSGPC